MFNLISRALNFISGEKILKNLEKNVTIQLLVAKNHVEGAH